MAVRSFKRLSRRHAKQLEESDFIDDIEKRIMTNWEKEREMTGNDELAADRRLFSRIAESCNHENDFG